MRDDLNKVVTERPRKGHANRSHKTRRVIRQWDEDGELKPLPKTGKMKMNDRERNFMEHKEFSDLLGPLKRWMESQVGRPWNKIYSEIRKNFPNNNKVNHHLIDTHLLGYVNRNTILRMDGKVKRIYDDSSRYFYRFSKRRELDKDELYVHPVTGILTKYRHGTKYGHYGFHGKDEKPRTSTGYWYTRDNAGVPTVQLIDASITRIGESWVLQVRKEIPYKHRVYGENVDGETIFLRWEEAPRPRGLTPSYEIINQKTLSTKEIKMYGLHSIELKKNDNSN